MKIKIFLIITTLLFCISNISASPLTLEQFLESYSDLTITPFKK